MSGEQIKSDKFSPFVKELLSKEIQDSGAYRKLPTGSVIVHFDSYIKMLPIVLKGSIKVVRTDPDGREILLYYILPGESCIMSFLAGIHNDTSKIKAVVEEEVSLIMIPVAKAGEWVKKYPEWTDFIFSLYQKRFEELLDVVNAVAFQKLDIRLLHLLKQKAQLYNSKEINITHQVLADELGSTREAVSRLLKQMEQNMQVKLSRNKITLL